MADVVTMVPSIPGTRAPPSKRVDMGGPHLDRGTVRIAGEDVARQPRSALAFMRRTAQIVFQNADSSPNPRTTVGDIVGRPLQCFAILPSREVPTRVNALLDLVRLPAHFAGHYPTS